MEKERLEIQALSSKVSAEIGCNGGNKAVSYPNPSASRCCK